MRQTLRQALVLSIITFAAWTAHGQITAEEVNVQLNGGVTEIAGEVEMTGRVDMRDRVRMIQNATTWDPSSPDFENYHMALRSADQGSTSAYIGLLFEQVNQYALMMRARTNGFHFTTGATNSYKNLHASGFNQSSDLSFKTDVQTIASPLTLIDGLRGVTFRWIDSGEPSVGFIAQEVEQVLPDVVQGEEGSKSVQYANIVAVAVEAIKALNAKVAALEAQVQTLEAEVQALQGQ